VDVVGKKKREDGSTPPSNFDLIKDTIQPTWTGYRASSTVDGVVYDVGELPGAAYGSGINFVTPLEWAAIEPTDPALTAKLLANTNPFRYTVSVPVMVAELIEASTLLKLAADNFFTLIGSQHLNYVFGWEQTMSDVRTLTKITSEIESRVKEFNSLIKEGGLRRKVHLGSYSGTKSSAGDVSLWSTHGITLTGRWTCSYRSKIWGSVRWKPSRPGQLEVAQLASFNEAARIVFDLKEPDASTIWEMIPFSWLVDYFVNIGDTLQALENTDTVLPYDVCIMRQRSVVTQTTRLQQTNSTPPWLRQYTGQPGQVNSERKLRAVQTITGISSLLSFGIMSERQATNLLALLLRLSRFKLSGQI
jgi:hypothetical protein